jgi:hypothetical protein
MFEIYENLNNFKLDIINIDTIIKDGYKYDYYSFDVWKLFVNYLIFKDFTYCKKYMKSLFLRIKYIDDNKISYNEDILYKNIKIFNLFQNQINTKLYLYKLSIKYKYSKIFNSSINLNNKKLSNNNDKYKMFKHMLFYDFKLHHKSIYTKYFSNNLMNDIPSIDIFNKFLSINYKDNVLDILKYSLELNHLIHKKIIDYIIIFIIKLKNYKIFTSALKIYEKYYNFEYNIFISDSILKYGSLKQIKYALNHKSNFKNITIDIIYNNAVENTKYKILKYLIKNYKSKLNLTNLDEYKIIHIFKTHNHDFLQFLTTNNIIDYTILYKALICLLNNDNGESKDEFYMDIKILLNNNKNINILKFFKRSIINSLIENKSLKVFKLLIMNKYLESYINHSMIYLLLKNKHYELTKLLIKHKNIKPTQLNYDMIENIAIYRHFDVLKLFINDNYNIFEYPRIVQNILWFGTKDLKKYIINNNKLYTDNFFYIITQNLIYLNDIDMIKKILQNKSLNKLSFSIINTLYKHYLDLKSR